MGTDSKVIIEKIQRIINELDELYNELYKMFKCDEVSRVEHVFKDEHGFITRKILIEILRCVDVIGRIVNAREELKQLINRLEEYLT